LVWGPLRTRTDREPPDEAACLDIAARYLAPRPRSRWEVRRRLLKAGADEDIADATLVKLERLGFVDDLAFARWWLEQRDRHAPRGQRGIEAELRQHGVAVETLAALRLEDATERPTSGEPLPSSEEERAAVALTRQLGGRPVPDDPRARQRLVAFLVRRGFSAGVAWEVVRSAMASAERAPEDLP
jgi:regulatory protein